MSALAFLPTVPYGTAILPAATVCSALCKRPPGRGELWCALDAADNIAGVMRIVPRGFCGLYHYLALIAWLPARAGRALGGI